VTGCAVEIKVRLFHIFSVGAFVACAGTVAVTAGEAEIAFFEDRITPIPDRDCKAEILAGFTDAEDAVLSPSVGP